MFPGKMTCPYRPAASATASAIPGLPCPAPWVHHDAHASSNARWESRTCGGKRDRSGSNRTSRRETAQPAVVLRSDTLPVFYERGS